MPVFHGQVIGKTRSICPVCGKQILARQVKRDGDIYMDKTCEEHGEFSAVLWRGSVRFDQWKGNAKQLQDDENLGCPSNCGICEDHRQSTCCVLYEITSRCNLRCAFCFADGGAGEDIPLEQVKRDIDAIVVPGKTFLQLSGGEPTVRDDLPEIIAYAKSRGCKYIQLNSNGIRLGEEEGFVKKLADAGLSFVFLQFDGTDDEVFRRLRGKPLLQIKEQAIANCYRHHIGVTLVPTLVPGVNTHQIGEILRFAIAQVPAVRGVHFQPVSYFGRYPQPPKNEDRYTMGELLVDMVEQSDGLIKMEYIIPSRCDHPLCGLHASFIVQEDGSLIPLTTRQSDDCCRGTTTAEQNREYIGRRWQQYRSETDSCCCGGGDEQDSCCGGGDEQDSCCGDEQDSCCGGSDEQDSCCGDDKQDSCCCNAEEEDDFDRFIRLSRTRSFTVTAMAFQDAYNLDIERLRQCSLHVYYQGKVYPFCARYLSLVEERA